MSSGSLCPQERLHSRDGVCPQESQDQIGEGAELRLSIWHSRMHKAFLMHVGSAMNTIEKQGHIKPYEEAHEAYIEQRILVKQAKAALAELDGTTSKGAGACVYVSWPPVTGGLL